MAPEARNQSRNPIQRLLDTEEKGGGLALFGWAGVALFAVIAAFASWQYGPTRVATHVARLDETSSGEITGGIKPSLRTSAHVPTVPTPLPDELSVSRTEFDQLRADLKDLRRVVGRVDVSTDVLARRISNLEDGIGANATASTKPSAPVQGLTPIAPPTAPTSVATTQPPASPPAATPSPGAQSAVPAPTQPMPPPVAAVTLSATGSAPPAPPQPAASPLANASPQATAVLPRPVPLVDSKSEKSAFDRNAVDRSTLERMLLQRSQTLDPDGGEPTSYIPPLPDPVSVVPKSRPLVLPPQPLTTAQGGNPPQPVPGGAKPEPKLAADALTTGSVPQRQVMPIDPTKAVPVPPAAPPEAAKPPAELSPEDQKRASEKMALAMREGQATQVKPAEPIGIDLGGFKSIGQVKKVWSDIEIRQVKLAKELTPLARLSEAADGVEIRLVLGPFADKEQAIRTCHQLRGTTAKCDPIAYTGESIATKTAAEPEHRVTPEPEKPVKKPPIKLDLVQKPLGLTEPKP